NSRFARTVLRNRSKIMESYGRDFSVGTDQTVMQRTHLKSVSGKLEQREKMAKGPSCEGELVMLRESNESEIETLKNSLKNVPEINGDPEELIAEINERNTRVNNVMVYKLNESNSQSLNERILHDKAEVVKILDIIDIKEDVIENVIRVGKKALNQDQ
ncbi:hypothetical protein HHI36_018094, partial [Cryptolaemus montrouzieri]